jgi:hypothetical protein
MLIRRAREGNQSYDGPETKPMYCTPMDDEIRYSDKLRNGVNMGIGTGGKLRPFFTITNARNR